jgi:uracil-DNA glycosylase
VRLPDQAELNACRYCDLWRAATQAVAGQGPGTAPLMLVGEQPGDEEDLQGRPFVGPAGRLLRQILAEVAIDPEQLYVTNAVKHFKWEPRGKRRLHRRPNAAEVRACNPWLLREIELVQPRVIVALGATAASAVLGADLAVSDARNDLFRHPLGAAVVVTYHPAAILRSAEIPASAASREALVADLAAAWMLVGSG